MVLYCTEDGAQWKHRGQQLPICQSRSGNGENRVSCAFRRYHKGHHLLRTSRDTRSAGRYQVPYVKEAVKMCLEASLVVPQVRYIGWDVAVTEKGPVIIEGNTFNAHDFWQLPPHTPDGIGMLPVIKKLVPDFKCHYKG